MLIDAIEKFNRGLGRIASYLAILMMLSQAFSVVARYVFSYGNVAIQETVVYGHALMFLLGAAVVLQSNQHVRVDVFFSIYSDGTRKFVNLVGLGLFVLPVMVMITWTSWPYVARAWSSMEGSRQSGGIPAIFLLKTAILVFSVSIASQAAVLVAKIIRGADWAEADKENAQS